MAGGDFNGDGFSDLAIGASGRAFGSQIGAGAVVALDGGPSGLSSSGSQFWSQDTAGI